MCGKQIYWYKRVQDITSITFFHQATSLHFIMVLPWFEIIASYMTNLKEKFECSNYGNKFNQKWASLLIYNNNFLKTLKYKFVLHLLKEDGLNRSVFVYLFVIFYTTKLLFRRIPLSYCFEETTRFDVRGLVSRFIKPGDIKKEF